eukprot:27458-Pelagococcus_subviridis.AAC.3
MRSSGRSFRCAWRLRSALDRSPKGAYSMTMHRRLPSRNASWNPEMAVFCCTDASSRISLTASWRSCCERLRTFVSLSA